MSLGLLVGAGLTQFFRKCAGFVFRREAMGFGDVTLMGMIGAFLGWQAAVLTFFLGPVPRSGACGMEVVEIPEKTAQRRPIIRAIAKSLLGLTLAWRPRLYFLSGMGLGQSGLGVSSITLYVIFWWMLGINRPAGLSASDPAALS